VDKVSARTGLLTCGGAEDGLALSAVSGIDDVQEVKGPGARFTEQTPRVVGTRSAAVASGWSRPGQLLPRAGASKEGQDVADGGFLAGGFG
jgi:hypothetical protein